MVYIVVISYILCGDILNPIKKGNFLVIIMVALLAFGLSSVVASVTNEDMILNMFNITTTNESNELIAVVDGNFTALTANQVTIQVKNNITNTTNTTNNTNNTNITNYTQVIDYLNNI